LRSPQNSSGRSAQSSARRGGRPVPNRCGFGGSPVEGVDAVSGSLGLVRGVESVTREGKQLRLQMCGQRSNLSAGSSGIGDRERQTFTPEFIAAARPARHAAGDRWFVDET
jgi:hypothetical protein